MHYPARLPAPEWTNRVLGAFGAARDEIDSETHTGINSYDG